MLRSASGSWWTSPSGPLSAAINDPTTAVQVLNHLEDLLRLIGSAPLRGQLAFRDGSGTSRLVMPGRKWEDYLTLAVTEIREYGSGAIQVARRLRAMLEDLRESVRPEHRPAVEAELKRLGATVTAGSGGSVDHDRAEARDRQGIGGPAEDRRAQDAPSQTGSTGSESPPNRCRSAMATKEVLVMRAAPGPGLVPLPGPTRPIARSSCRRGRSGRPTRRSAG